MTAETALGSPFDAPDLPRLSVAGQPGDTEHTPEQLLISALLDTGSYTPAAFGVADDSVRSLRPVHLFCAAYQADCGEAPPLRLVHDRFPSFRYMAGVSPVWAAAELSREENSRRLRKALMRAGEALRDESPDEAAAIMREASAGTTRAHRPGSDIADVDADEAVEAVRCPIPPGPLADLTGGIGPGELWITAARTGVGKTWNLIDHAIAAAESGWDPQ